MSDENLIGKMLGRRYEIIEKIGTGGMATVYKAKCHLLNRFVAVKVLREELKSDEEIVKKFNVESQSAASLSHHNIVSIYDVGEENGISYIVMEYVEGITLKEYIRQKKVLPWREACQFAEQICAALDHAHKKHIIHRDIKPHNILITHDLTLKVTDFGIARAVSSETLVVGSTALGSVHYISPEQARGGYTDERSDIYSMGVVLYEMLTGKVPFDGENPVSIALMHIEKEAKNIKEINPDVPDNVVQIVIKAMAKEQHLRYQTAMAMLNDLKNAVGEDYKKDNNKAESPAVEEIGGEKMKKGKKPKVPKTPEQIKEDRLATILALITVIVILGVAAGTYLFIRAGTYEVQVPNLINMTLDEAKAAIKDTKFTIEEPVSTEASDTVEAGRIISQDPGANESVKKNTKIKLVVSSGKSTAAGDIEVPNVVNLSYDAAVKALKDKKLKYEKTEETSETVSENTVIRQSPESGTKVAENTVVKLYVSTGSKEKVSVPDLSGETREKAENSLKLAGLQLGSVTKENSDSPVGTVIKQSPAKNSQVSKNSFVSIVLSSGPSQTEEPEKTSQPTTSPTKRPAATSTANPVSTAAPKQKILTITFPEGYGDTINVKVVANGQTIYNKQHSKSEGGVRIPVQGTKDANVQIYLNGNLVEEKTIEFD
ncbi:MAG: Stk1 family PASTA domain-containing Ser/Thr kinase [Clostridia bacterium]|nr:Stk1 family PASTA domain-containing Ser/Thr kinase [Clostridia bacterium]